MPGTASFGGRYLISSDRGVMALQDGQMFQITPMETYGMAVRGGELFIASSSGEYSSVCKCSLPARLEHGSLLKFREIYRVPTSSSGRIHQIAFFQDVLAVTQTVTNSIVLIDPQSGEAVSECFPFRDQFGKPILGDHNHINSVSACGDCLLFCAYRAGRTSMIGIIHGNQVRGYPVKNVGVHDVCITGDTLYYSDTFGATFTDGGGQCGFLMANGRPVDEDFFSTPPGFAIRGFSQQGNELVVGHSHKGLRAKRFEGRGSLFRLINGRVVEAVEMPFAQVYDILGMDGNHFEAPPAVTTWAEAGLFLESILGPCVYEVVLDEALLAPVAKPRMAPLKGCHEAAAVMEKVVA